MLSLLYWEYREGTPLLNSGGQPLTFDFLRNLRQYPYGFTLPDFKASQYLK